MASRGPLKVYSQGKPLRLGEIKVVVEHDARTLEIKHILNDFIDRGGLVDQLTIRVPRTCLKEILQTFDRDTEVQFKIDAKKTYIDIEISNWRLV